MDVALSMRCSVFVVVEGNYHAIHYFNAVD